MADLTHLSDAEIAKRATAARKQHGVLETELAKLRASLSTAQDRFRADRSEAKFSAVSYAERLVSEAESDLASHAAASADLLTEHEKRVYDATGRKRLAELEPIMSWRADVDAEAERIERVFAEFRGALEACTAGLVRTVERVNSSRAEASDLSKRYGSGQQYDPLPLLHAVRIVQQRLHARFGAPDASLDNHPYATLQLHSSGNTDRVIATVTFDPGLPPRIEL